MRYKKYTVIEVRKFLEGQIAGSTVEVNACVLSSRIDAYGVASIRKYQIGKDSKNGLEYIIVGTKIIEEEVA